MIRLDYNSKPQVFTTNEKGKKMKGYKFKVEFWVWERPSRDKAREELEDCLLRNGNEEGFNITEPEFMEEVEDPIDNLKKEAIYE